MNGIIRTFSAYFNYSKNKFLALKMYYQTYIIFTTYTTEMRWKPRERITTYFIVSGKRQALILADLKLPLCSLNSMPRGCQEKNGKYA